MSEDRGIRREADWLAFRALSKIVECPWCHVAAGKPCKDSTGWPLAKAPAHPSRIEAARVLRAQHQAQALDRAWVAIRPKPHQRDT